MITDMIIAIVTALVTGAIVGVTIGLSLGTEISMEDETDSGKPIKLLTAGCSVKYHGRVWKIKRFMVNSENQPIAVIESQGDGEIILRRTMAAVEELEVVPE